MNILVLGASSFVGASVAESFSQGNRLLLTGRDAFRLKSAAQRCRKAGAVEVAEVVQDLGDGPGDLSKEAVEWRPDIIINAASASSRLRDDEITDENLGKIVSADLSAPFDVIRSVISERRDETIGIIFISSFLSIVSSPDRAIYGALKQVHEKVLLGLAASHPGVRLMIVRISKRIPAGKESPEAERLGSAVFEGYRKNKKTMYHGISGRMGMLLFNIHPAIFTFAVKFSRFMR